MCGVCGLFGPGSALRHFPPHFRRPFLSLVPRPHSPSHTPQGVVLRTESGAWLPCLAAIRASLPPRDKGDWRGLGTSLPLPLQPISSSPWRRAHPFSFLFCTLIPRSVSPISTSSCRMPANSIDPQNTGIIQLLRGSPCPPIPLSPKSPPQLQDLITKTTDIH